MRGDRPSQNDDSRGHPALQPHQSDFNQLLRLQSEDVAEEIRRSESLGDGRVNLFLTLVGVSLAALAAAVASEKVNVDRIFLCVTVLGFVALLLVGWCTFLRILQRNVRTDSAIEDQAYLARFLAARYEADEKMRRALAFNPYRWGSSPIKKREKLPNPLKGGGLAETMVLLNSIIFSVLLILLSALTFTLITFSQISTALQGMGNAHLLVIMALGLLIGWGAAYFQMIYAGRYYNQDEKKRLQQRKEERKEENYFIK